MKIEKLIDFRDPEKCGRLVIKIGSALLVDGSGGLRTDWLRTVITEVHTARDRGQEIVIVSSGSIALGASILGFPEGGRRTLADAQASAAVGQIALAKAWSELLAEHNYTAAQMLLTLDDLEGRRRYLNASATLGRLLKSGVVPVINENDSIATNEIRFGDNDRLAARVAQACKADGVMLLSDVDGLYNRHPGEPGAERLDEIRGVTEEIHQMAAPSSGSGMGSGGMSSKILAAEIAERAGIALAIIDGTEDYPMGRALAGLAGTVFQPKRDDKAFKSWIGGRLRFNGAITVDEGCVRAIVDGNSLLAAGVTGVEGEFDRGDVIEIKDGGGRIVGKGVAEYSAQDVLTIKGTQNSEHEALLGFPPRSRVIHRDQLVLV